MAENTLNLSIVTPYGRIFEGGVKSVVMPGSEGEMGVLPGHSDLLSTLKAGVIEFETLSGSKELVAINWGHAKINSDSVDILADGAVAISGEDMTKNIAAAKKLLEDASDDRVAIGSVLSRIER